VLRVALAYSRHRASARRETWLAAVLAVVALSFVVKLTGIVTSCGPRGRPQTGHVTTKLSATTASTAASQVFPGAQEARLTG